MWGLTSNPKYCVYKINMINVAPPEKNLDLPLSKGVKKKMRVLKYLNDNSYI